MMRHFDVIVIGAGVNGLSAGWHLVHKEKQKVLILEQFPFPHTRGSSHGHSRITRNTYLENHFCKMMKEAFVLWDEVERLVDQQLFLKCGRIAFGSDEYLETSRKSLESNGCDFDSWLFEDVKFRFPQFKTFINCRRCIWDPNAGVLLADKCLKALQLLFIIYGGIFKDSEPVLSVVPDTSNPNLVTINTSRDVYTASSVVITAGGWMGKILRNLDLDVPIQAQKVLVTYWKLRDPTSTEFHPEKCPIFFYLDAADGSYYYSTPVIEYPGCIKIAGVSTNGFPIDPDLRDAPKSSDGLNLSKTQQFIAKFFPQLESEPAIIESCMYTMSPDHCYILDHHPMYPNIVFGTGFSGAGFKTGPVVGKILSYLALNKQVIDYDLSHYRLDRFSENKAKL